jgi:hypothetical protein
MATYQECDGAQLPIAQSMILRQLNGRLKPELGLSIGTDHVDMKARLLT